MGGRATSAAVLATAAAGCTMDLPAERPGDVPAAAAVAYTPARRDASPEIAADAAAGPALGRFDSEAAALAAWRARGGGRTASAQIGDWTVAVAPDGQVYGLIRSDKTGSGENQRPPQ